MLIALSATAVAEEKASAWQPPAPAADVADWIQLVSGEWLKGEIKGMENDKIQFDSDKLDLRTFDLDDVVFIRSPRSFDLMRSDRSVVSGPLQIDTTTVHIGDRQFPRTQMTAFSASGASELQHWAGEISAGFIARSGNVQSVDLTYHIGVTRRTARTRLELDYTRNISKIEEQETANNQRGTLTYDRFLSDRTFVRAPSVEYVQDKFQNIERRITLGASYGYDLFKKKNFKWDTTLGPAWQTTRFYSVQAAEDREKDALAIVFTTHLEADLTDRISYTFDYTGQLTRKEIGETTHHAESILEIDLTKRLELDLSLTWDRVSQPKPDDTGIVPKQDDLRLSASLSITF